MDISILTHVNTRYDEGLLQQYRDWSPSWKKYNLKFEDRHYCMCKIRCERLRVIR